MKRDMDFIRDILLDIEGNDNLNGRYAVSDLDFGMSGDDRSRLQYHLRLLMDADLIKGKDGATLYEEAELAREKGRVGFDPIFDTQNHDGQLNTGAPMILIDRLTWEGCQFLDTIRDEKVWAATKEGIDKVGSFTFEGIKAFAKGFLKQQIQNQTGIEVEF